MVVFMISFDQQLLVFEDQTFNYPQVANCDAPVAGKPDGLKPELAFAIR